VRVWLLRVVWFTLPLSAGQAAADALASWSDTPEVLATVLLWLAWAVGGVALLAPRPAGLTALRTIAPAFVVLAVIAAIDGRASTAATVGALVATVAAAVLVADSEVALYAVNGSAYGEERRFPLRTPPGLFLGPLPAARVLVAAGIAAGPLLVADGRYALGAAACVVGAGAVVWGVRAMHGLSVRWAVLVPAGVVVVDPLTLADPILFVRAHVRALRPFAGDATVPEGTLDLRLGAALGTLAIVLDDDADLVRVGRGRRPAETLRANGLLVAVVRRAELLRAAAQRRVRVEVVDPGEGRFSDG